MYAISLWSYKFPTQKRKNPLSAVIFTLLQVAGLHAQQGSFSTAEALYNQAREIYEEAFGSDHYLVAKELDALAVLYQKQGK